LKSRQAASFQLSHDPADSAFRESHKVRSSLVLQFWEGPKTAEYPLCDAKIDRGRGECQFLVPLRAGSPSTFSPFPPVTAGGNGETINTLTFMGVCQGGGGVDGGNCGRGTAPHREVKAGMHDSCQQTT